MSDTRHWADAAQLPPADLARMLGTYAARVMTPRGSTAVTGLELMTALHRPTRASEPDATGRRHSEHNPGSLGKDPVDCAPCEAPDGHPQLKDLPRFHRRTRPRSWWRRRTTGHGRSPTPNAPFGTWWAST